MKKAAYVLSLLFVLLCLTALAENTGAEKVTLHAGDIWECPYENLSQWETNAPDIMQVSGSTFTALAEGEATLTAFCRDGMHTITFSVTKAAAKAPQLILDAIDYALNEWEELDQQALPRCNKYTLWYSNGNKYEYGWCAAFECYCLYHVGIPMVEWTQCTQHPDGDVWGVKANGVGKVIQGYDKMDRLTFIPRTGYLVVYGKKNSGNSMHIGLITDCEELGDGKYLIKTVEGNMSNTVKRYCFLYDMKDADESKALGKYSSTKKDTYDYQVYGNYGPPPEEYQTEKDIYQYEKQVKDWYIFRFCATWF